MNQVQNPSNYEQYGGINMTRIGMIGGFGPESTLDYYRLLIETHRSKVNDGNNPEIVINSMNMGILMKLVENRDWDQLVKWLVEGMDDLYRGGADFGFISANTPHIVFDRVSERSPIPLISIVDETCRYIRNSGSRRVALLGTSFTMQSDFYPRACQREGIEVFLPNETEQAYIQDKLMTEIELGMFLDETRQGLLSIIKRMKRDDAIEGVILGCTELPLILPKSELGIPFFNTTKIHVESIIQYYLTQ